MRRKFVMALAYVPKYPDEDPEIVSSLRLRIKKGHYVYVPAAEFSFEKKSEFISQMVKVADSMWNNAQDLEDNREPEKEGDGV